MPDQFFSKFLRNFSPYLPIKSLNVNDSAELKEIIPLKLIEYVDMLGFAGFGEGLFWLVDPREHSDVTSAWLDRTKIEKTGAWHLFAYGAFGDLFFVEGELGRIAHIFAPLSTMVVIENRVGKEEIDSTIGAFFSSLEFEDLDHEEMFEDAVATLGPLEPGEMYGFFPALALGGAGTLDQLRRVSAVEHLVFLAQLDELQEIRAADR